MKSPLYNHSFHILSCLLLISFLSLPNQSKASIPQELLKGFTATPNPTGKIDSQPILTDPTGNFSLSILRLDSNRLDLAIIHVPSHVPLWRANPARLAQWGKHTEVHFNGSLVITDPSSGVVWSTKTNEGDRVILTSAPNLQILSNRKSSVLWQSFDFPYDTLVENQNFTSAMQLVSSNGLYTMRLGTDFIGMYAKFKPAGSDSGSGQIYYKHRALEAKAEIIEGKGPIWVRITSDGYLGMYQTWSVPADVQAFNSYQRSVAGPRWVRIESDGNLKGYYWSGSDWVLDYQAIPDPCELPSPCGSYGLCHPGDGCSCLDNSTHARHRECYPTEIEPNDFCGPKGMEFRSLKRTGVELPFKELMEPTKTASYEECEKSCERNCTCWGALYNNASGFCYSVDYPIQTILGVGDEGKMGYFKVWDGAGKKKVDVWLGVGIGLLCGAIVILGVIGFGGYKLWKRNRRMKSTRFLEEEDITYPGPYKDLGSTSSGSIELSSR